MLFTNEDLTHSVTKIKIAISIRNLTTNFQTAEIKATRGYVFEHVLYH